MVDGKEDALDNDNKDNKTTTTTTTIIIKLMPPIGQIMAIGISVPNL